MLNHNDKDLVCCCSRDATNERRYLVAIIAIAILARTFGILAGLPHRWFGDEAKYFHSAFEMLRTSTFYPYILVSPVTAYVTYVVEVIVLHGSTLLYSLFPNCDCFRLIVEDAARESAIWPIDSRFILLSIATTRLVFGVLNGFSVYFVYSITKILFKDGTAALFAAAIIALLPVMVQFSWEINHNNLGTTLALLILWGSLRSYEAPPQLAGRWFFMTGLLTGIAAATKLTYGLAGISLAVAFASHMIGRSQGWLSLYPTPQKIILPARVIGFAVSLALLCLAMALWIQGSTTERLQESGEAILGQFTYLRALTIVLLALAGLLTSALFAYRPMAIRILAALASPWAAAPLLAILGAVFAFLVFNLGAFVELGRYLRILSYQSNAYMAPEHKLAALELMQNVRLFFLYIQNDGGGLVFSLFVLWGLFHLLWLLVIDIDRRGLFATFAAFPLCYLLLQGLFDIFAVRNFVILCAVASCLAGKGFSAFIRSSSGLVAKMGMRKNYVTYFSKSSSVIVLIAAIWPSIIFLNLAFPLILTGDTRTQAVQWLKTHLPAEEQSRILLDKALYFNPLELQHAGLLVNEDDIIWDPAFVQVCREKGFSYIVASTHMTDDKTFRTIWVQDLAQALLSKDWRDAGGDLVNALEEHAVGPSPGMFQGLDMIATFTSEPLLEMVRRFPTTTLMPLLVFPGERKPPNIANPGIAVYHITK